MPDGVSLHREAHRVVVYEAPVARLLRTRDLLGELYFGGLGPALLASCSELQEAVTRLRRHDETPLTEALIDQRVVGGIANVWKVELSSLLSLARTQMLDNAYGTRPVMRGPLEDPGGL